VDDEIGDAPQLRTGIVHNKVDIEAKTALGQNWNPGRNMLAVAGATSGKGLAIASKDSAEAALPQGYLK
jgi:hypothetical protein